MNLRNIYTLFFLIACAFVFQSRSAGPAGVAALQVTGAPGSTGSDGTCGNTGCHAAGAFDPSLTLQLLDMTSSEPVTQYQPGETYLVDWNVVAGTGTPSGYGFQAVALDDAEADVSEWSGLPNGLQSVTLGGRNYLEHSSPTSFSEWQVSWTAPAAGTGNVTFYSAALAINGNGNTSGDGVAVATLAVSEMKPSSIADIDRDFAAMKVAPNPISDRAQVFITTQVAGEFQMNILNVTGQQIFTENTNLIVGQNTKDLNLGDLESGLYFLQLIGANQMTTEQIIKL